MRWQYNIVIISTLKLWGQVVCLVYEPSKITPFPPSGRVIKKYHYNGDEITYVTQSDGKIYRFTNDHFGKPIFMSYNNNQYWYQYDQHGNVIRLTDNN